MTVVRTNPGTGTETREQAQVLCFTNVSGVVLKIGDHIEVLRDDGLPARGQRLRQNFRRICVRASTLSITVNECSVEGFGARDIEAISHRKASAGARTTCKRFSMKSRLEDRCAGLELR